MEDLSGHCRRGTKKIQGKAGLSWRASPYTLTSSAMVVFSEERTCLAALRLFISVTSCAIFVSSFADFSAALSIKEESGQYMLTCFIGGQGWAGVVACMQGFAVTL